MAINLNDNTRVKAGKPSEAKYLSTGNTVYATVAAVNAAIPIAERHVGLTVNVANVEYWYKSAVTDISLIEKKFNTEIPIADFVTGATNLGTGSVPIFAAKVENILNFKSLKSLTTSIINITSDDDYIYFSGSTGNQIIGATNGLTSVGNQVKLGGTLTGTTTITDSRTIKTGIEYADDYGSSFSTRSLVDRGYVDGKLSLGGERIYKTICQPAHTFGVGQVVGWSASQYTKPIADGTYDGEVLGIVTKCFNADCFELTQAGYVTGLTGMIMDCTYFLSANVAGLLTPTEPSVTNYLSKSMLIANSSTSGWVLPYAGYIISSGITDGGALVKNVCLPTTSTYIMNNGDFFVGMGGGSVVQLPFAPKTGMVVIVADVCGNVTPDCAISISGSVVGGPVTTLIDTKAGSLSYIYNGTKWNVMAFSPAIG